MSTPVRGSQVGVEAQFEYTEIEPPLHGFKDRENRLETLNAYGSDGWELVFFSDVMLIFKREVTEAMRLARTEMNRQEVWNAYAIHLRTDHDHTIYIGDAVAIHSANYSDCEFGRIWETS